MRIHQLRATLLALGDAQLGALLRLEFAKMPDAALGRYLRDQLLETSDSDLDEAGQHWQLIKEASVDLRSEGDELRAGWELVCPDNKVRHYPYHSPGDAERDAEACSERGCLSSDGNLNPFEQEHPRCPEGLHSVRRIFFARRRGQLET